MKAKTGLSSVFTGQYDDPNHVDCAREIKVPTRPPLYAWSKAPIFLVWSCRAVLETAYDPRSRDCDPGVCFQVTGTPLDSAGRRSRNKVAIVTGTDGKPFCTDVPEGEQKKWKLSGTVAEDDKTVLIDFSSKGGPTNLVGKWDKDGIVFPDGNKWTKRKEIVVKNEPYVFRPTNARVQAPEVVEEVAAPAAK